VTDEKMVGDHLLKMVVVQKYLGNKIVDLGDSTELEGT
jgi:hypothetical protein